MYGQALKTSLVEQIDGSVQCLTHSTQDLCNLRKILSSSKMEDSFQDLAPFERLPNEVLILIIKMAMDDIHCDCQHNFLTDVIGNISSRFSNLPAHPPFWKGRVCLCLGTPLERERERKLKFLGEGVECLCLTSLTTTLHPQQCTRPCCLSPRDLNIIARQCPRLRHLSISGFHLQTWPTFETPCPVECLQLCRMNMAPDTFANSALHEGLPEIKVIEMSDCRVPGGGTIELPDVGMCPKLNLIKIEQSLVAPAQSEEGGGRAASPTTSLISLTTRGNGMWQRRRYHQFRSDGTPENTYKTCYRIFSRSRKSKCARMKAKYGL